MRREHGINICRFFNKWHRMAIYSRLGPISHHGQTVGHSECIHVTNIAPPTETNDALDVKLFRSLLDCNRLRARYFLRGKQNSCMQWENQCKDRILLMNGANMNGWTVNLINNFCHMGSATSKHGLLRMGENQSCVERWKLCRSPKSLIREKKVNSTFFSISFRGSWGNSADEGILHSSRD